MADYISGHVARVREAPTELEGQVTLGLVYAANQLWPEALAAFENAERLAPDEPHAVLHAAIAAEHLGRTDESWERYRSLTERFPDFAPGFDRWAEVRLDAGDLDGAEAAFRRLVELRPQDWRGYAGLGHTALRREDYAGAVAHLEQALRVETRARTAWHQLGLAYRHLGRIAEAERALARGGNFGKPPVEDAWSGRLDQHRKLLSDQFRLALALAASGRTEEGAAMLEEARDWHPDNLDVMSNLAIVYHAAGRTAQARELVREVTDADDSRYRDFLNLAIYDLALGQHDAAREHAARAVELAPGLPHTHLTQARVLMVLGDLEHARRAADAARELAPADESLSQVERKLQELEDAD